MFKSINRNNRRFMLGNFLFALSYGLWMNLRQIHLLDLGATPAQIGTVFALISVSGGLLPLPAGMLADRIGPKRIILFSWLIAAAGAAVAGLASTWPFAGAGYILFMLCIAANPATVSYVLLNTADRDSEGNAERVMATVFASWPAAMIFAPALGGILAGWLGVQADLWIGAAGLLSAVVIFSLAGDTRPATTVGWINPLRLAGNLQFVKLAAYFSIALMAMYLGYTLAPAFLEDARGFSTVIIGTLFSISSVGTLLFRNVVVAFRSRLSFTILVGAVWLGMIGLWLADGRLWIGVSFFMLGALSTTWVVMQASIGRCVAEHMRGLALGVSETLYFGAMAVAAWLAGHLYGMTADHELPLILGSAATLAVAILWLALPWDRQPAKVKQEAVWPGKRS